MSDFDADAYIKDHAGGTADAFDVGGYIADHQKSKEPGFFDGSVKSTIDALPMIGGAIGGVLGTPADAVTGPMGNIVGAGIGGYLGTATKNLINHYYDPASAPKTTADAITQPIVGGAEQGLMQGAGEGAIPALAKSFQATGDVTKWAATKALSNMGGVAPDVIKEYASASDRIKAAPSVDALKDISDKYVGSLSDAVADGKIGVEDAKTAYKEHVSDVSGAVDKLTSNLKDDYKTAGYEAREGLTSAVQTLNDAHTSNIKQVASDVYDTVDRLRDDVVTGSNKALDVLDQSGARIDLAPVHQQIANTVERLRGYGTAEANAVADQVESWKALNMGQSESKPIGFQAADKVQELSPATYELQRPAGLAPARWVTGDTPGTDRWAQAGLLGKQVSPPVEFQPLAPKLGTTQSVGAVQAKRLVQGLGKLVDYSGNPATFDELKGGAFKDIKDALNAKLKATVPDYATAMLPVAADTDLLSRSRAFGDRARGAGILQNIDAPAKLEQRAALDELGKKYGQDFIGSADPKSLPEYKGLQQAQAKVDALRPDRVADKIEQTIGASRQQEALNQIASSQPAKDLAAAKTAADQAKQNLAPFKSLAPNGADQTAAQQKLNQLASGKNIELTDMFQRLGKLTDTDFVQAMHDRNVQDAFQKGAYNGSRNAVRFGGVGGAVGYFLGGLSGAAGGMAGGKVLGGIVDQYGPAITKRILDGAIQVSRSPTAQTIMSLSIPDAAKKTMLLGLQNYLMRGKPNPKEYDQIHKALKGAQ